MTATWLSDMWAPHFSCVPYITTCQCTRYMVQLWPPPKEQAEQFMSISQRRYPELITRCPAWSWPLGARRVNHDPLCPGGPNPLPKAAANCSHQPGGNGSCLADLASQPHRPEAPNSQPQAPISHLWPPNSWPRALNIGASASQTHMGVW